MVNGYEKIQDFKIQSEKKIDWKITAVDILRRFESYNKRLSQ